LNFESWIPSEGKLRADDQIVSIIGWGIALMFGGVVYVRVLPAAGRLGKIRKLPEGQSRLLDQQNAHRAGIAADMHAA
jgi:hypothetical protein